MGKSCQAGFLLYEQLWVMLLSAMMLWVMGQSSWILFKRLEALKSTISTFDRAILTVQWLYRSHQTVKDQAQYRFVGDAFSINNFGLFRPPFVRLNEPMPELALPSAFEAGAYAGGPLWEDRFLWFPLRTVYGQAASRRVFFSDDLNEKDQKNWAKGDWVGLLQGNQIELFQLVEVDAKGVMLDRSLTHTLTQASMGLFNHEVWYVGRTDPGNETADQTGLYRIQNGVRTLMIEGVQSLQQKEGGNREVIEVQVDGKRFQFADPFAARRVFYETKAAVKIQ